MAIGILKKVWLDKKETMLLLQKCKLKNLFKNNRLKRYCQFYCFLSITDLGMLPLSHPLTYLLLFLISVRTNISFNMPSASVFPLLMM